MTLNTQTITLLLAFISASILTSCTAPKKDHFLLGSGIGINNPSLLVHDMDEAIGYYKDTLGFSIRGSAAKGAYNGTLSKSILFGDMTGFELLSVNDTSDLAAPAFITNYLAQFEGVRSFALSTSSVDSTYQSLIQHDFSLASARPYRTRDVSDEWNGDDGAPNRISLDFDEADPPAHFPRFIEQTDFDYIKVQQQWRTYYSYRRMFRKHANGVVGSSAVRLVIRDLSSAIDQYKKMGLELLDADEKMARFGVFRNQEIHLLSKDFSPATKAFLNERGEGVFAIRFEVGDLDHTQQFFTDKLPSGIIESMDGLLAISSEYAKGVQLEFVQEPESQSQMASMLSFTGRLDKAASEHASNIYIRYCALCHGDNREGYAADNAPSLRSNSLLATSMNNNYMRYAIQFGRGKSAMAGYLDSQGGPLELIDIEILLKWLYEEAGVEEAIDPSRDPVYGDIANGANIYTQKCAACHGEKGEGISAPALGNPMLLATATDHFLRYAIAEGRDGTPMVAFKDSLSDDELDDVTAFLRSRASGWDVPEPSNVTVPTPDQYVLNPDGPDPEFELRDGKFVSAVQVDKALKEGRKMVIMDARSEVAWRQMHIPGAFPVPYYEEPESFIHDIPNDGTQIVVYCACPHAASLRVLNTLKRYDFEHVAIIDEGILVWAQMGLPVQNAK